MLASPVQAPVRVRELREGQEAEIVPAVQERDRGYVQHLSLSVGGGGERECECECERE